MSGIKAKNLYLLLLIVGVAAGCGGGDDDKYTIYYTQDNGVATTGDFCLEEIYYGRPLLDESGVVKRVVNPDSLIEIHPLTGDPLPGYPKSLNAGESLDELIAFDLGKVEDKDPGVPVVPRNAVLLLEFSRPVDAGSLNLDAALQTTEGSSIRVFTEAGDPVPIQASVQGTRVILNPLTGGRTGFPALPRVVDQEGDLISPIDGFLKVCVLAKGEGKTCLKSVGSGDLRDRPDLLGSPVLPVGFNPGRALPDLVSPRIIREVRAEGTAGPGSSITLIVDPTKNFVIQANKGLGEWSGGLVTLRPGEPDEETAWVIYNTSDTLFLAGGFVVPPVPDKDEYIVGRPEFYEPIPGLDPATSVDPVNFPKDPDDPEDEKNWDLYYFAFFHAWNEGIKDWEPVDYDYESNAGGPRAIDPKWRISFRFSEPMDLDSFRPYENFIVCDGNRPVTDPCFDAMKIGRVTGSDQTRVVSFEPMLEDQYNVTGDEVVGFGGEAKDLRLVLRVIPPEEDLQAFYEALGPPHTWPEEVVPDLGIAGVLSIMDLSGNPLGLPGQLLDLNSPYYILNPGSPGQGPFPPAVDLKYDFATRPTEDPEYGALVHRFMGLAETALGGIPPITGLKYMDHPDKIYGPKLTDLAIGANGYLSGHPVEFIEHVFDDYNHPPPSSAILPENTYPDPISKMPFGVGTPVTASFGCRFQHVYRRGDISPDAPVYEDTILDLVGLAWSPFGGNLKKGLMEKMSIGMADSNIIPNTHQVGGIPVCPNSGLRDNFHSNYKYGSFQMVVGEENDGIPYQMDPVNLFKPKNAGNNFNLYLPWPDFEKPAEHPGFPFTTTNSLLIEYRLDPNFISGLPQGNAFHYHAGIISSMLPRFRVFSRGGGNFPEVYGATKPEQYPIAWGPVPGPGVYGDNARYFALIDYAKRVSLMVSFYLGPDKEPYMTPPGIEFLYPVISPPLSETPNGATLTMKFQTTIDIGNPYLPKSDWVAPEDIDLLNQGAWAAYDFIRFNAVFEGDLNTMAMPILDTVVLPYRK